MTTQKVAYRVTLTSGSGMSNTANFTLPDGSSKATAGLIMAQATPAALATALAAAVNTPPTITHRGKRVSAASAGEDFYLLMIKDTGETGTVSCGTIGNAQLATATNWTEVVLDADWVDPTTGLYQPAEIVESLTAVFAASKLIV